jgi:hypothetical protein
MDALKHMKKYVEDPAGAGGAAKKKKAKAKQ